MEVEEVEDKDAYAPCAGPHDSQQILELADGSNDDNDDELLSVSAIPSDADITMVHNSDNNNSDQPEGDWEDKKAPETVEEELGNFFL